MIKHVSKRAVVNGVNLHHIVAGEGPVVLGMHGSPQNHREFLPLINRPVLVYSTISVLRRRALRQKLRGLSGIQSDAGTIPRIPS